MKILVPKNAMLHVKRLRTFITLETYRIIGYKIKKFLCFKILQWSFSIQEFEPWLS